MAATSSLRPRRRPLNLAYSEMMIAAAFAGLLLFTQAGVSPVVAMLVVGSLNRAPTFFKNVIGGGPAPVRQDELLQGRSC